MVSFLRHSCCSTEILRREGYSRRRESRLTDPILCSVEEDWDFVISMKNKKEGNSVEKFSTSLLYSVPLAKTSNSEKTSHIIFES